MIFLQEVIKMSFWKAFLFLAHIFFLTLNGILAATFIYDRVKKLIENQLVVKDEMKSVLILAFWTTLVLSIITFFLFAAL